MTPRQTKALDYLAGERRLDDDQIAALVSFATDGRRSALDQCTDADLDALLAVIRDLGTVLHLWRDNTGTWSVVIGTPLFAEDGAA